MKFAKSWHRYRNMMILDLWNYFKDLFLENVLDSRLKLMIYNLLKMFSAKLPNNVKTIYILEFFFLAKSRVTCRLRVKCKRACQ